jgi:hypothetical protein
MRTAVILIGCLGLGVALAQETSTNKPPVTGTVDVDATAVPPNTRAVQSLSQPAPFVPPSRVEVGGAIPKAAKSRNFFQMINPLAPKQYGDGTDVVARHPITGEAQGVTLLLLSCPERPNQPKAKKAKAAPPASGK